MSDLTAEQLQRAPSELEIAEALRWADSFACEIIRRLAFQRDALRKSHVVSDAAITAAALSIMDAWDDWDGEAQQAAQVEQDYAAYRDVMLDNIKIVIARALSGEA